MTEWSLRHGTDADVAAMYALDVLCFQELFRFSLQSMRRFARRPGAVVLVADGEAGVEDAYRLAGFVIVHVNGSTGYVVTLDVLPGLRRSGLARRLMVAAAVGLCRMELEVYKENAGAIAFYEALGYERTGLRRDFYGEGMDAWIYSYHF